MNLVAQETAETLADMGKLHARDIAPYETGKTVSLIKKFVYPTAKGYEATIVAQNPTASDGHKRNIKNFNLVRWMHTSSKALGHIYSGDPRFMYSTQMYLEKIKKSVAQGKVKDIKIGG
jgi:hypothetical protein